MPDHLRGRPRIDSVCGHSAPWEIVNGFYILTLSCARVRLSGKPQQKGTAVSNARATPERLSMFSHGVFAVLITVLVLELRPPEVPTFKGLLLLWHTWLSYAVSYLFIAIVWTNHHHLMRYATEATPRLM
jgi:hypothetical protein